jgi:tRNA-splicing ligase RtcB (3'-phosphate/5'-hydroxy nucleic acid ligase)
MTHPLPEALASHPQVSGWLCEPLPEDVGQSLLRLSEAEDVRQLAIMPDVHLAADVCIGTALATTETIYPSAVGSDIGCGMAAIGFAAGAELLSDEQAAANVLAGLYETVPANKHRTAGAVDVSELPDPTALSESSLTKKALRTGRVQLGTLGRGNHFVELQSDTEGRLWLMVHSGSRGMGQQISRFHLEHVRPDEQSRLPCFDADSREGQAYLNDVAWAVAYAAQNRMAMVRAVEALMQRQFGVAADWETLIHSDHNHVRSEEYDGKKLWVHRKGALPAAAGQAGIIPGSMGSSSFHVAGRGCIAALCSSSHGAGRSMSRRQAARTVRLRDLERQMRGVWFDRRQAEALRDEAPSAYKDIGRVMQAQKELTRIVRPVRPLLCYKGN